jgi:hypothetical protein
MDVDWGRYLVQILLVVGIYYALVTLSPLPRLPRGQQFAVFGGIVFVALLVFGLVWP